MKTNARIENLKGNKKVVNWLQRGIKRCHKKIAVSLNQVKQIKDSDELNNFPMSPFLKVKIELHVYKHCINVLTRGHDLIKDLQFYLYGGIGLFYKSQDDRSEFEIDLTWEVINSTLNRIKLIKR
jgi:hypothetical protein